MSNLPNGPYKALAEQVRAKRELNSRVEELAMIALLSQRLARRAAAVGESKMYRLLMEVYELAEQKRQVKVEGHGG